MTNFKTGDPVKVIRNTSPAYYSVGDTGTVHNVDRGGDVQVTFDYHNHQPRYAHLRGDRWCVSPHSLVKLLNRPDELKEAVEAYLKEQDALDNRELVGMNAEDYFTVVRRRNAAREDLDAVLAGGK